MERTNERTNELWHKNAGFIVSIKCEQATDNSMSLHISSLKLRYRCAFNPFSVTRKPSFTIEKRNNFSRVTRIISVKVVRLCMYLYILLLFRTTRIWFGIFVRPMRNTDHVIRWHLNAQLSLSFYLSVCDILPFIWINSDAFITLQIVLIHCNSNYRMFIRYRIWLLQFHKNIRFIFFNIFSVVFCLLHVNIVYYL